MQETSISVAASEASDTDSRANCAPYLKVKDAVAEEKGQKTLMADACLPGLEKLL